jgi:hypothetical protein
MTAFQSISAIQRTIVTIFYALFCISIIYPIWMLFSSIDMPLILQLLLTILIIVVFVILGAFFFLIVSLPEKLSRNFDGIRNGIADGSINTIEKFAEKLNSFMISQFNYVFFDIEYTAIAVKAKSCVFYCNDFPDQLQSKKTDVFMQESSETEKLIYKGRFDSGEGKLHLFLLPVHFGDKHLGYILIYTNSKLSGLFKAILADFENYYVDDQLLHVISFEKAKD